MLTQANVRQFKNLLEQTLIICNEMIATREYNKLFRDEKDYRDSKIAAKIVPDNFFKVRLFDEELELRYNNRTKRYYIYVETSALPFSFKEINSETEFKNIFSDFSRPSPMYMHFTFSENLSFDDCVLYFKEFLRYYLFKSKGDLLPDIF